jgi:hypothetical protein
MRTLMPGVLLGTPIMDYMLFWHWYLPEDKAAFWVSFSMTAVLVRPGVLDDETCAHFRKQLLLPEHGPVELKPVVVPIFLEGYYFLAVFDYRTCYVHTLGANCAEEHNIPWETWNGHILWVRIAAMFGWSPQPQDPAMSGVCWGEVSSKDAHPFLALIVEQEALDTGYLICYFVMVFHMELCFDDNGQLVVPTFICGHANRRIIVTLLEEQLPKAYSLWIKLNERERWEAPTNTAHKTITSQEFHDSCNEIRCLNVLAEDACTGCREAHIAKGPDSGMGASGSSTRLNQVEEDPEEPGQLNESPDSSDLEEDDREQLSKSKVPAEKKRQFEILRGARNRGTQICKPPPREANIDIPPQKFMPILHNPFFDDYLGGPTLESMRWLERQGGAEAYPISWFPSLTQRSSWEIFKDYGYRLEPSFSTMFNTDHPISVKDHVLSIAKPGPIPHLEGGQDSSISSTKGSQDSSVIGLLDLLDDLGEAGTRKSMEALVQGKINDEVFVLDLEKDAYPVSKEDIILSVDIDSIIWVTAVLRVRTELSIHLLPDRSRVAPIGVHNHVYVDLLLPQSEEDQDTGSRHEWWTHKYPLSTIPHAHFGKVGQGSGSLNVYVFWPRMKHKNHHTGRSVAIVPPEIQARWISKVVLPSIVECSNAAIKPYVDFTLQQLEIKQPKGSHSTKSTVVDAKDLEHVQSAMRKKIKQTSAGLGMFGSFFFVADMRGIKKSTTSLENSNHDPYVHLAEKYQSMDWDYMMNRANGELYFDLGMAFHPAPQSQEPLVGLWRLDKLRDSFSAAGMNSGTKHSVSTLAGYGGIQSEMDQRRAASVQLVFRSAYNLVFEIVRRPGNAYFCDDSDAHDVNRLFLDCVDGYQTLYLGSSEKSYGVRDEIRGSGRAILEALPSAFQKACNRLHQTVIL